MAERRGWKSPQDVIAPHLQAGETLLWADRPASRRWRRPGWRDYVFPAVMLSFAAFIGAGLGLSAGWGFLFEFRDGTSPASFLVGMVLLGLVLLFFRYVQWRVFAKSVYGVSDRRAFVFDQGVLSRHDRIVSLKRETPDLIAERLPEPGDVGHVWFEIRPYRYKNSQREERFGFEGVGDPGGVLELMRLAKDDPEAARERYAGGGEGDG